MKLNRLVSFAPYLFAVLLTGFGLSRAMIGVQSDSQEVVSGAAAALGCIKSGVWTACPDVHHYALYQYIPSALLQAVGVSEKRTVTALAWINLVSVWGMVIFFLRYFSRKKSSEVGWLGVGLLITSPFLFYSKSTFGEALAAFLILLFAGTCLEARSFFAVVVAGFAAGLTKETSAPFLILLGGACLLKNPSFNWKKGLPALVAGVGASYVAGVAFNLFRFGSPFNTFLLQPAFQTPDLKQHLNQIIALWFSPNGGLVFFWPTFVALLVLTVTTVRKQMSVGLYAVLLALVLLTVGLGKWFSPFGWQAWGPRLMLPWLPAMIFIVLRFHGEAILGILRKLSPAQAAIGLFVVWIVSLPQVLIVLNSFPIQNIISTSESCPVVPSVLEHRQEYFYRCIQLAIWPAKPIWVDLFKKLGSDWRYPVLAVLYGLTLQKGLRHFLPRNALGR